MKTRTGRYSVNAAAAAVLGLDSNTTYNILPGSAYKVRGRWYVELEDMTTGERHSAVRRSMLFDRFEHRPEPRGWVRGLRTLRRSDGGGNYPNRGGGAESS